MLEASAKSELYFLSNIAQGTIKSNYIAECREAGKNPIHVIIGGSPINVEEFRKRPSGEGSTHIASTPGLDLENRSLPALNHKKHDGVLLVISFPLISECCVMHFAV